MTMELELVEDGALGGKRKRSFWANLYKDHEGKFYGLLSIAVFLGAWEWIGTSGITNPMFTSSPSLIVKASFKLFADSEIYNDIWVSLQEFLIGFGLSIVVGIPMGILLGWYKKLNYTLDWFVTAMQATPRVALLPLIIIWFGIGMNSKIAVIFLGAIFPVLINTFMGVRTLDEGLLKAARSFGANDRQIFTTIALPASVPFILSGLQLGVGRSLIGVVVGELYAATAGIGHKISIYGSTFQTDKVFVGVMIICLFGIFSVRLLQIAQDRFDSWRPERVA